MERQILLGLAGALAMAPRFAPPIPVVDGAMPVVNIEAALALHNEMLTGRKPFGLELLRQQTGVAAVFSKSPDAFRPPWVGINEVAHWGRQTAAQLHPRLADLLQVDHGLITIWAWWAHRISMLLDELQRTVLAEIGAVGLPGQMRTVEQFARHANVSPSTVYKNLDAPETVEQFARAANVSPSTVYKNLDAPDASRRPPAMRIGGAIRFPDPTPFPPAQPLATQSPANSTATNPPTPPPSPAGNSRQPRKPKGSNTIPGTGSKSPW